MGNDANAIDHPPLKRGQQRSANYQSLGDRNGGEPPRVVGRRSHFFSKAAALTISASATFLRKASRSIICCLRASTKTTRMFEFLIVVAREVLLMREAPYFSALVMRMLTSNLK